uniref:60 kDa chaperonin 1 n=1 Tax=Lygus hesperus TaxID=30085 RepID=A0A0A9YJS8_LYGHE
MYQRFLMSGHSTHHINQRFNLLTRKEHGKGQGKDILNRDGIRSFSEYTSATGVHQNNYNSMDTRSESYSVENECSQEEDSTVRNQSSPNERHNRSKQLATVEERRKIAEKRGNSQLMSKIGLEAGSDILNSSLVSEDLDTPSGNTKPVQNAATNAKVDEIKDSDRIHENIESIDGAISVKRSKTEPVKKDYTESERRFSRSSQRGRKDFFGDTSMETAETKLRSSITEHEESSGDILLSKLRKFFNESLPKFDAAVHSKGNFSLQASNENDTPSSSPIFTIDLSSDNETTDLN